MFYKKMVDENGFKLGDHLIVERTCFTHHGIYAGSGTVIENRLEIGIVYMPLTAFADGSEVRVRKHPYAKYNGLQALERAQSRLGEKAYNLVTFNCEHFVNWCIEGVETSRQVDNTLAVLAPLSPLTDKLPIIGELTKEARQKAIAGHLATDPNDHETTAHFDPKTQIRQFKEDITGNNDSLANGIEAFFDFAQKFCENTVDVEKYVNKARMEQAAAQARNLSELFNVAERITKEQDCPASKQNGREVAIAKVCKSKTMLTPAYNTVGRSTKDYPKGQEIQDSYDQTHSSDFATRVEALKRQHRS